MNELLIKDVVGVARPVHSVRGSATVEEVVQFLAAHHISSAPIVDAQGQLSGIIDYSDVLHHFVAFGMNAKESLQKSTWEKFRVLYLSDISSRNPLMRLTCEDKLTDALELLFSGVHRILIVDPENRRHCINILTQSDLLKFLNAHSELIPLPKQLKSVAEQDLGTQSSSGYRMYSVLPSTPAREAFQKMKLTNMGALPIVDEKGSIISQISASDIRVIFSDSIQLELLDLTSLNFVEKVREKSANSRRDLLIFVTPDINASGVLAKMVDEKVHRVFITDNMTSFRGVISISDLFEILL